MPDITALVALLRLATRDSTQLAFENIAFRPTKLNTAFIERLNLSIRQGCAYLRRRSPCHARKKRTLAEHLEFFRCSYNFARPHNSLKFGKVTRTPAMQAGLATKQLNYGRSRLILEPNAAYSEPSLSEKSGMMLVASEDDLSVRRILFVSPNSPAAEAGIEKGDEIIEIDDRPADAQSLHATRRLFCEPGEFRLKVRRGEETWTTTLRARDLL